MTGPIWAILLAAGESSRMGRPKQLLPWAASTLLTWQVEQLLDAGVDKVVVVTGAYAGAVAEAAEAAGATVVENAAYGEGRASSLRAGAAALPDGVGTVVVLGVDQPRPAWLTRRLLEASRDSTAPIVTPLFQGHRGHPVLLAGSLLSELRTVDEATLGLRDVLQRHAAERSDVPIESPWVVADLNTEAQYEQARRALASGEWDLPRASLDKGRDNP